LNGVYSKEEPWIWCREPNSVGIDAACVIVEEWGWLVSSLINRETMLWMRMFVRTSKDVAFK
jgi:hypothetical protein